MPWMHSCASFLAAWLTLTVCISWYLARRLSFFLHHHSRKKPAQPGPHKSTGIAQDLEAASGSEHFHRIWMWPIEISTKVTRHGAYQVAGEGWNRATRVEF